MTGYDDNAMRAPIFELAFSLSLALYGAGCGSSQERDLSSLGEVCTDRGDCIAGLVCTDISETAATSQCHTLVQPICMAPRLGCVCRVSASGRGSDRTSHGSLVCND